jgi:NADPH:quinone reductase-like Zn-dependent oxidoreductase
MSEGMKSARVAEAGGKLYLETLPVPEPGPGQVLVKMEAAPVNPSDLASISRGYLVESWPMTPGLEGAGTVVKAGSGILPRLRLGKKVACSPPPGGQGTWAEYICVPAQRAFPLPAGLGTEKGSMMLVNPMTAVVLVNLARKEGHRAMVNTAAASALGKMLIRLSTAMGMPLINVVRSEAQAETLRKLGAGEVLNSQEEDFDKALALACANVKATLALDAISGEMSGRLLHALPEGGVLLNYARLSGDPMTIDPSDLIRTGKSVRGFQLGYWLKDRSLPSKLSVLRQVKKHMEDALSSPIARKVSLEDLQEGIRAYTQDMSAGKTLIIFDGP